MNLPGVRAVARVRNGDQLHHKEDEEDDQDFAAITRERHLPNIFLGHSRLALQQRTINSDAAACAQLQFRTTGAIAGFGHPR